MATLLSRSAWAKFPVFRKQWPFSRSKGIHIGFLVQIRNQRLKIEHCAKFQPDWTKNKGGSNFELEQQLLSWNNTENCLMTSHLPHSDDVSKIIIDFERFCSRALSWCTFQILGGVRVGGQGWG